MTADLDRSFEAYRASIDARLAKLLPAPLPGQEALAEAMRASVLAPGKRLRPLMTVLAAEDLGGGLDAAIDAGCAVEMVHAASLVLDDLPCMDDAALRRGRPSIHVEHGEDVAVLASVAVLTGAYQLLTEIRALDAEARIEAVAILTRAVGVAGLVGGQFEDLRGGRGKRPLSQIVDANGLKTGSLFSAAVEIGGVVAGVADGTKVRLREFAAELGHAFQLLDDLLDGGTSAILIGKDIGKDAGKSTVVSLIGRASVERQIERHVETAHERLTEVFGARSCLHALVEMIFDQPACASLGETGPEKGGRLEHEAGAR